jgi:hypothetical protein
MDACFQRDVVVSERWTGEDRVGLRLFLTGALHVRTNGSRACAALTEMHVLPFDQVIIMNKAKCFNIGRMYEDYRE